MSADDQNVPPALTRDQVLDELEFLATVEHALIVECLSVCYALGYDLDADQGGPTTEPGGDAARAAAALAQSEMFSLKGVNQALIAAGRAAQLGRAASISSDTVPATSLDPPGDAQLQQLAAREHAIGTAADERYARLRPAVTTAPVFDGDLLGELQLLLDRDPWHAAALASVTDPLAGLAPGDYLRATRRDGADAFEERLLDVSDRCYRLVTAALQEQFDQSAGFSSLAIAAMETLDQTGRLLVQRGLLPPFTSS